MPIDDLFIKFLSEELNNELCNTKIKKIYNLSQNQFVFTTQNKKQFYIGCNNEARVNMTNKQYSFPTTPSNFTMYLRKYLSNFKIISITNYNYDRIIKITFEGLNEIKDLSTYYMYVELFGRYSNLILTTENNIILNALKLINNDTRTILPNYEYITKEKTSYFPSKYVDTIDNIMINPTHSNKDLYFINIFNTKEVVSFSNLSDLLEDFYTKYDKKRLIKNISADAMKNIDNEYKKLVKKIAKIHYQLNTNSKYDEYRLYGDLILTYGHQNSNPKLLECKDFENNNVKITLDANKSVIENSNYYYKKYQKSKRSIEILKDQIKIAEERIKYLDEIKFQIEIANEDELKEILAEFKTIVNTKISKSPILKYKYKNCEIYVGKNNIQNNEVTFKIARKGDLWFHIKDLPGAHVILKNHQKDLELITIAAEIAGHYSKGKNYPSVDIMYTDIKNVKKVSGSYLGHVSVINDAKYIKVEPKNRMN